MLVVAWGGAQELHEGVGVYSIVAFAVHQKVPDCCSNSRLKISDSNKGSVVRQCKITIIDNSKLVELLGRRLIKWGVGASIFFSAACPCQP
jgi:hypothetical protein